MQVEDASQNPRILSLTRLMAALRMARTPFDTLQAIRQGFGETYGAMASMLISTLDVGDGEYRLIQMRKEGDYAAGDSNPFVVDQFPLYRGGVVSQIISTPGPHIVNDLDWSTDPHFADSFHGYRSVMAVPFNGNRLPMNWNLLMKQGSPNFTVPELQDAVLRTVMVGSLLESQTLSQELTLANERIDGDIRQVAALQRMLLPDPLPKISGLQIAVSYEPSGRAGGDLYDFFPLDDEEGRFGRWCVFIGDASGHGPAAAVVMAILQSILHTYPADTTSPADLLTYANRHLCRKKIGGFVTAFLAIYQPDAGRLDYASAGHPPPLLKSAAHQLTRLDAVASYPLGIDPTESFKTATVQQRPGDTLLLYTDGITEARDSNHAMFELEQLETTFRDSPDGPDQIIEYLRQRVEAHQRGQKPLDDQTLVVATKR